jgi:hypothetical protein
MALITPRERRMIIYIPQNEIIKCSASFLICVFSSATENAGRLSSLVSVTEDNGNAWLMAQRKENEATEFSVLFILL